MAAVDLYVWTNQVCDLWKFVSLWLVDQDGKTLSSFV